MKKYHYYLTYKERKLIIESLIAKKNELLNESKYTDGVDDLLIKFLTAKTKKIRLFST